MGDKVDLLIDGRGDVEDGVGARKVEGRCILHVALHSFETRVGLELGRDFLQVAVVASDDGVGSLGQEGPDGGLAGFGRCGDNGDVHFER